MNMNNTMNGNRSHVPNDAPVSSGSIVPSTERGTINWKRKLTSRKFWLSVASFTAMLLVAMGKSQETATQVTSLIMAGATVIGYAIGEGLADGGQAGHSD